MNAAADKKLFARDEANRTLPLVRLIVQDIVDIYKDVHDRRARLLHVRQLPGARDNESVYSDELDEAERELEKEISRLDGYCKELRDLGVELKDPILGLVDFPCVLDGREVYLCWKLGESEIAFWHELNEGFQGRQPLAETSQTADDVPQEDVNP